MMQSTLKVVRQLAADILKRPIDEVPVTATRESVPGWDSMAHLNLVLAVEQHFDIQFLPDEMLQMLRFGNWDMDVSEFVVVPPAHFMPLVVDVVKDRVPVAAGIDRSQEAL